MTMRSRGREGRLMTWAALSRALTLTLLSPRRLAIETRPGVSVSVSVETDALPCMTIPARRPLQPPHSSTGP